MVTAFKTPGVYLEEITTFPPSVVAVETAIPAFIGYTARALDDDGTGLAFVPTRITSLLEFERWFGEDFEPSTYNVQLDVGAGNAIGSVSPRDAANQARRYYLYGSVRHFYANGGGPCYIVSVGSFATAPALGDTTTPAGLRGGLMSLERFDEPTLLVFPDGVSLGVNDLGSLQSAALEQCAKLQDRFVIMDLRNGDQARSLTLDPPGDFRGGVGTNNLKYGAAYYPWLVTIYRPEVRFHVLSVRNPSDLVIANTTLDALTGDPLIDPLVGVSRAAAGNVASIVSAVNIAGMAGSGPLVLNRNNFAALSEHFATLLERLRATAGTAVSDIREPFGNLVLLARATALALQTLDAATLPSELTDAVDNLRDDSQLTEAIVNLIAFEKHADVLISISATRTAALAEADYASLSGTEWIAPNANAAAIAASTEAYAGANGRQTALNAAAGLQEIFDALSAALLAVFQAGEFLSSEADRNLFALHPVYRDIAEQVQRTMSILPASGAVSGVYAATDRTRGVWKAPANVSLADVLGPTVRVNDIEQSSLNVHSTGKSINVIRAFTGKGTLIWGARTLSGNDNEWRYVSVRRFFNMVEESVKNASEPFVFEPNSAATWVRVRAMIENFLTVQWRQGALAGAKANQAFYVKVGLGETMSAEDILEGRMIVEIGLAVVRPAEFIVLKFSHKMQVS